MKIVWKFFNIKYKCKYNAKFAAAAGWIRNVRPQPIFAGPDLLFP